MSAEEPNPYQNLVGNGLSQLEADVLAEYKHLADTVKEVSGIVAPRLQQDELTRWSQTSKLMKQVLELSKGPAGSMRAVERNFGPLQNHVRNTISGCEHYS